MHKKHLHILAILSIYKTKIFCYFILAKTKTAQNKNKGGILKW
jgi:hypothetical protein